MDVERGQVDDAGALLDDEELRVLRVQAGAVEGGLIEAPAGGLGVRAMGRRRWWRGRGSPVVL